MPNYNKVILAGHMTRDPELRSTPTGQPSLQFTLGINRKYKGKDGATVQSTTWASCAIYGAGAESIAKYCRKGSAILVEGELRQDDWTDKQTNERKSRTYVFVNTFQFLSPAPEDRAQGPQQRYERRPIQTTRAPFTTDPSTDPLAQEEVPF